MPETACLHIQAGESDPVRVVDLSGGSVRIGRAAYCDVRLPEAELAEEECRLRRRGDTWQLFPVQPSGSVWLDGRHVDRPSAIEFGVPFRVGEHWLTLRESAMSPGPWGRPLPPSPSPSDADDDGPASPEASAAAESAVHATDHRADWQARSDRHDRWLQNRRETKRWESRLRAVGETLRSGDERPAPPVPPTPPVDRDRSRRADLLRDSFARRPAPGPPLIRQSPAPAPSTAHVPSAPLDVRPLPPAASVRMVTSAATRPETPTVAEAPSTDREPEAVAPPVERESVPAVLEPSEPRGNAWLADMAAVFAATPPETPTHEPPTAVALSLPVPEIPQAFAAIPAPDPVCGDDEGDDESAGPSQPPRLGAARRVRREGPSEPAATDVEGSRLEDGVKEVWTVLAEPPPFLVETQRPTPSRPGEEMGAPPASAAVGATRDAGRPPARQRRPPRRERVPAEPRTARAGAGGPAAVGAGRAAEGREATGTAASARDWPSVSDILAAQGARTGEAGAARPALATPVRGPIPTVAREPGHWRLPLWIGWLPATAAVGLGLAGVAGAWAWSVDGYNAGVVARRLAGGESAARTPLPEGVNPGDGSWWRTSAAHLVRWAAYLDRAGDDPAGAEEARALLGRAGQASPLNPTVRYALAHPLPGEPVPPPGLALARSLGQSRDVLAMTWAGHQLLASGKKDAALLAYREALAMAARTDLSRPDALAFLDDPQARRYAVPTEDQLAAVVHDMAESGTWSYKDWSAALPRGTAAALAAARVLRERASPDAGAALDAALAEAGEGTPAADGPSEAVRLAAGAAASAMKQRWEEARDRYRMAIDLMPADQVRRAWWLNVANVAVRLGEESERVKALELAKNTDTKDEITERAVELQKQAGVAPTRSVARVSGSADGVVGTRP